MAESRSLFTNPSIQQGLKEFSALLDSIPPLASMEKKALQLKSGLQIVINNAATFDRECQQNIAWIGSSLSSRLSSSSNSMSLDERIDDLYSTLYRFVVELDLAMKEDLSIELRKFQAFAAENRSEFGSDAIAQMRFADQQMPVAILKGLLHQDEIRNFKDLPSYVKEIDNKFRAWNVSLDTSQANAEKLQTSLESYENAFNFVGLYDGFRDLAKSTRSDLGTGRFWLVVFGLLVLCPFVAEASFVYENRADLSKIPPYLLASISITAISFTLILIYFFRIALRRVDAAKSQLLQLELRKTLCQFIQSYATYSAGFKEKTPELLAKFESVIFSGIVSSDDKLPSTFDGIEQLSKMVGAIRTPTK